MNNPAAITEVHIKVEDNDSNAVELLHDATGHSKQKIKTAMTNGAVWLTRGNDSSRLRRAKRSLQTGDEVHLYYDEKVQNETPPTPTLISDQGGYSVWFKPRGMRSQGSKWGDHCTIMRWAEQHLQPERTSFTVHRLDLAASGLILVAHSKKVAAAFGKLFHDRLIEKRYLAIVNGDFSIHKESLRIEHPVDGKHAASEARCLQTSEDKLRSLVEVRIETGRKHQIRRHLAEVGFPIRGDRMYGQGETDGIDLQLTACYLAFECQVNHKNVEYRLPDRFKPEL
ncbi:MAG: RluA family pseudouridine synthase [Gammaproteobacteria bacterium]